MTTLARGWLLTTPFLSRVISYLIGYSGWSIGMAENLRLDSRFSMIGAFWSPETPDTILKGTLVSDEREINFIMSTGPRLFAMPDSTMIPAFHGFTQDGLFTLCQLVEQPGPNSTNFAVGQAIKGPVLPSAVLSRRNAHQWYR